MMNDSNTITYEHPGNELVRVCLRLEYLFEEIEHAITQPSQWDSRSCLQAILEAVCMGDRPELKTQLTQELSRHMTNLSRWQSSPGVDQAKISAVLAQISSALELLHQAQGRLVQSLKNNEFLNTIRLQVSNVGGACNINTPSLNCWLHLPAEQRQQMLKDWYHELNHLKQIITAFMSLVRNSSIAEAKVAENGFYEVGFEGKSHCLLVRIEIAHPLFTYPEISLGRHRLCIRFLQPGFNERALLLEQDVPFKLTRCML